MSMYWWWTKGEVLAEEACLVVDGHDVYTNGVHPKETYVYFSQLAEVRNNMCE